MARLFKQEQVPPLRLCYASRSEGLRGMTNSVRIGNGNLFGAAEQFIRRSGSKPIITSSLAGRPITRVGVEQLLSILGEVADCVGVVGDIPLFEHDSSLREECRDHVAGWSPGLVKITTSVGQFPSCIESSSLLVRCTSGPGGGAEFSSYSIESNGSRLPTSAERSSTFLSRGARHPPSPFGYVPRTL